jgi:hypothetical protein
MQVKTGTQCVLRNDRNSVSYSFKTDHLKYWSRQPVPVFAALVPVEWPVDHEPDIYIIDITSRLLVSDLDFNQQSITLDSEYCWPAGSQQKVIQFISNVLPLVTARQDIRKGIIASKPTLRPQYVQQVPYMPVSRYRDQILFQVRRTAANAILFLENEKNPVADCSNFRKNLASILEVFHYDAHWENFMARGLSYHHEAKYALAIAMYEKACQTIENDPNVRNDSSWKALSEGIMKLRDSAASRKPLG